MSRHNFDQRGLDFGRRRIHKRRTQAHISVRRLRRWRCFDSTSDSLNHQFGLEAICEIKNKDEAKGLTKPLQPTTFRRYVYDVDARPAREYWSIKPIARDDRRSSKCRE